MIIKQNKERTEGGDESAYLIALVLTPLSLMVWVKTLPTEAANCTSVWLEFSIGPNILSSVTHPKMVGLRQGEYICNPHSHAKTYQGALSLFGK
jgi:hypothetical protein